MRGAVLSTSLRTQNRASLDHEAYDAHPERFVYGLLAARRPLTEVWINKRD